MELLASFNFAPILAVVMVGFDPAIYFAASLFYGAEAGHARRQKHPYACLIGLAILHMAMALKKLVVLI